MFVGFLFMTIECLRSVHSIVYVRLAAHVANGCKSLIRPSSGKDTAKTKGVHREVESEGSLRQNLGLRYTNHI